MAFGSFQHCHRRTVTQLQIVDNAGRLQTAAAFCLSGLQQGLPYNDFSTAVAPAFPISSPFYIAPLCSSSADRAAVLLRTGAGVNRRFPTVAGRAFPPDLLMAACCHHLRRQRPVQLRIPLCGKAWLDSRKIVKAGKHFLVCTIRAFRLVTDSVRNGRTEGMSLFAAPPYAAVGRGRYRIRRAVGIFLPIPFAAISGNFVCRSFSPVRTAFPAQIGQPLPPLVREEILVLQLCPFGHIHQTRREVPGSTCSGVSGAFFS